MKITTVDEMRRIEAASDATGHSYTTMMEQAGRAVAEAIVARREVQGRRVLTLVGPGNNGGDGLVAARYLAETDAGVVCYLYKPRDPAQDDNFRLLDEHGIEVALVDEDEQWSQLRHLVRQSDVIIDALLGTGTRLPLRGKLAEMLNLVNQILAARKSSPPRSLTSLTGLPALTKRDQPFIVAVDGPSGLDYDSGALDQAAIPADLTITFAYPKRGHFRFPGAGALGELVVANIGTDPKFAEDVVLEVVTPDIVRQWLPPRPLNAHKGTFGKTLIVAGSANYTGAAYLAGAAATRAGAGLVTLALPALIHAPVAARLTEATYLPLPHEEGAIAAGAIHVLEDQFTSYDALLLGPGLSQRKCPADLMKAILREQHIPKLPPLVIDADGLNILARMEGGPQLLPPTSILTPHPGEMARLMNCSTKQVQTDRIAAAQSRAKTWRQVIVLKGAYTVVAAPDGRTAIEPFATPGLATAGTGDVLAGTIVALRAQGLGPFEAAVAGAYVHGLAGEMAQRVAGAAGTVASDVLAHLTEAWQRIA